MDVGVTEVVSTVILRKVTCPSTLMFIAFSRNRVRKYAYRLITDNGKRNHSEKRCPE